MVAFYDQFSELLNFVAICTHRIAKNKILKYIYTLGNDSRKLKAY